MKILIFGAMAVAGVLLVAVQHQQVGTLRAENAALSQSSTEADRLKADLAKSTGNEAQDAEEMNRLREENRDLLKLRNEVNQLREVKTVFEKVSLENKELMARAKAVPATGTNSGTTQTIVIPMVSLFDRGLSTPEFALQTFYWAQREKNSDAFIRTVAPESRDKFRDYLQWDGWRRQNLNDITSIEIVARRDVDTTTVQLGVQLHESKNPQHVRKIIVTLAIQGGEWRVQTTTY
jgi:hypothetical protein